MNNVDFIEIGTSDFDTLIQECDDTAHGLCVEPINYYLEQLPNRLHVKKINCAISFDDTEGEVDIFYIPKQVVVDNNLDWWLTGVNSINDFHPMHKGLEHLVIKEKVKKISIARLLTENDIKGIKFLKIDTEGGDCDILRCLMTYLKTKDREFYPRMIKYESNHLTPDDKKLDLLYLYCANGYRIVFSDEDTVLKLLPIPKSLSKPKFIKCKHPRSAIIQQ